jgi:hypothetical protein
MVCDTGLIEHFRWAKSVSASGDIVYNLGTSKVLVFQANLIV